MTDEQKIKLKYLMKKDCNYNIFEIIEYVRKNLYGNNGNFILSYNSKIHLWVLKGRLITIITKDLNSDNFIKARSLEFLKKKFLKNLELYLEREKNE
jgi:hypothetical protein